MSRPALAAVRFSLAAVCVLAPFSSQARAQQPPAAGVVKSVIGAAFVVRAGQEVPATPGQAIGQGDALKTGADGRLGVTLKDGTRLSLGSNTELRLDSFAYAPAQGRLGLALKVLRGVTAYISGRIAQLAPGAVKIETPTSVIGIRGTHLVIGVGQP